MQALDIIERERPRLCDDFAIIITGDSQTARYVAETAEDLPTTFVGFSLSELTDRTSGTDTDFLRALQARLYSKDLYWISTAIKSSGAFYGRRSLLGEALGVLRRGNSHIGLFGLRRMGKTSFLYRLLDYFRTASDVVFCHVDIQRIDAIRPTGPFPLEHWRSLAGLEQGPPPA
jgi:serine/threonine-protein kinase